MHFLVHRARASGMPNCVPRRERRLECPANWKRSYRAVSFRSDRPPKTIAGENIRSKGHTSRRLVLNPSRSRSDPQTADNRLTMVRCCRMLLSPECPQGNYLYPNREPEPCRCFRLKVRASQSFLKYQELVE